MSTDLGADVSGAAKKLNLWADMAARAYGAYSGINASIAAASDKSLPSIHHAHEIRQQLALMSVIRTFALLDRDAGLSMQSVHRFLKREEAIRLVAESFALSEPPSSLEGAKRDSSLAVQRFLLKYGEIDWTVFGRLQSFRNVAISHITWREVDKFVTYGELEHLVRISCALAGEFTFMTSGLNDWPEEQIAVSYDDAFMFWSAALKASLT
ncbi:hypothetical protein ABLE91_24235 [Aquabacter sp. CN5-332]